MKKFRIPVAALAFVCLWAFIALFPITREILRASPASLAIFGGSVAGLDNDQFDTLAHRSAASPVAPAWKLERSVYGAGGALELRRALGEIDRLSARFPADLSLRAQRLQLTLMHPISIQTSADVPRPAASKQWLGDGDWKLAASIAQAAEKRDADNAFWPWMSAIFHFARRENEPGIAALERASRCLRFDDYSRSTLKARMLWFEKVADPIWEERISLLFSAPFPSVKPMGDAISAATLDAIRARKSGDGARAARIGAALLGACRAWNRGDNEISGRVSQYAARRALEKLFGIREPKGGQLPSGSWEWIDPKIHDTELVRAWTKFALQNGAKQWSQRADFLPRDTKNDAANQFLWRDLWREFGLRAPWGHIAFSAPTLLMFLFLLCWLGALLWLSGALANRFIRSAGDESASTPTRGEVAGCANFSFWAMLGVSLVFLRWFWANNFDVFNLFLDNYQGQVAGFAASVGALLLGSWLLPIAFAGWKRGHRIVRAAPLLSPKNEGTSRKRAAKNDAEPLPSPKNGGRKRVARAILWAIFLVSAFAAWTDSGGTYGYRIWDDTPLQMPYSLWIALAAFCSALALDFERLRRINFRFVPRFGIEKVGAAPRREALALRLARIGLWLLCPALIVFALGVTARDGIWPDTFLILAFALAVFGAAWFLELRGARRDRFLFALRLSARSAGVLSLAWSVVFLMLCLALWPLRLEFNHQLDRRLQIGETAWMREQVAAAPRVSD